MVGAPGRVHMSTSVSTGRSNLLKRLAARAATRTHATPLGLGLQRVLLNTARSTYESWTFFRFIRLVRRIVEASLRTSGAPPSQVDRSRSHGRGPRPGTGSDLALIQGRTTQEFTQFFADLVLLPYGIVILSHDRRRVLHFNVTANPSAAWTAQQLVNVFPWDGTPKYMIRDRDSVYASVFRSRVKHLGVKSVVTARKSPWQNPFIERLIGSARRDCLDDVIVMNERHLMRVLKSYFE